MTKAKSRVFLTIVVASIFALFFLYLGVEKKLGGCFLAQDEMARVLGSSRLESLNSFPKFEPQVRAQYVKSLIEDFKTSYRRKSSSQIADLFGQSDGYFKSKEYPNYSLSDGWNLVFALDREGMVKEAFVWRQSCRQVM